MGVWTLSLSEKDEEKLKQALGLEEICDDSDMNYAISLLLDLI